MIPNSFYKVKDEYIDLIQKLGGVYHDRKSRPMYYCKQDDYISDLYWLIPTSDINHRLVKQMKRINYFINLPDNDIRSCYYHKGHTDRPAIFKISNILPITSKYIDDKYILKGKHLILKHKSLISELNRKISRILLTEDTNPNKFEQKISNIRNYLILEMAQKMKQIKYSEYVSWMYNIFFRWINNINKYLPSFENVINEIFYNIDNHSDSNSIGYVKLNYINNKINITIFDKGVGIPYRIRLIRPDIINDSLAILKATEQGFTTKSTPRNRGAGLDIIIQNIIPYGKVKIKSGYGEIIFDKYDTKINSKLKYFHGTLVNILIDLNNINIEGE